MQHSRKVLMYYGKSWRSSLRGDIDKLDRPLKWILLKKGRQNERRERSLFTQKNYTRRKDTFSVQYSLYTMVSKNGWKKLILHKMYVYVPPLIWYVPSVCRVYRKDAECCWFFFFTVVQFSAGETSFEQNKISKIFWPVTWTDIDVLTHTIP